MSSNSLSGGLLGSGSGLSTLDYERLIKESHYASTMTKVTPNPNNDAQNAHYTLPPASQLALRNPGLVNLKYCKLYEHNKSYTLIISHPQTHEIVTVKLAGTDMLSDENTARIQLVLGA